METAMPASENTPDISGTWIVKSMTFQDQKVSVSIPMEIRRVRQPGGNIDFLIDMPWAEQATRINVQWNAAKGSFSGSHIGTEDDPVWILLKPGLDARTLHVFVRNKPAADGELTTSEQEWILKSKTIATEFDPADFGDALTAMYPSLESQPARNASSIPEPVATTQSKAIRRSLPASPQAQRLVEQLQAQESAAASEADEIRRLQNSGQNDSDKSVMAGHQRRLTSLLSTAFDLKMQLEELQVKELQARLIQLDRQIGQRKLLREQIIERRVSELIEEKSLKWSPEGFSAKAQPVSASADESSLTETDANSTEYITIDLYGGSGVLPGIKALPRYNKLIRDLNGLKAVVTNFRVAGEGTSIAMAIVRDPSQLCRREMQRTNTESQLRLAINAGLKAAGIENIRWEEAKALTKDSGPTHTANDEPTALPQTLESLRSPAEMQAELKPFRERIAQCEAQVRSLEGVYFLDRSNAAEMQAALDKLEQARAEFRPHLADSKRELQVFFSEAEMSKTFVKAMEAQWHTRIESLSQGNATEADVRQASEAYFRAAASSQSFTARCQEYESTLPDISYDSNTDWMTAPAVSVGDSQPRLHPDVALAWLEGIIGQKLELVRLDGLKLPVTAALRTRETSSRLEKGDLLVTLNGCRFESLDQAVAASRRSSNTNNSMVLRGGLGGQTFSRTFFKPSDDCLFPAEAGKALVKFELRVRRKADDAVEALYVNGVCVAMDGLVVIPVAASSLVEDAPIVIYGLFKGTAKIVASDEQHGLTLVKLDVPSQPFFQWVACQSAMPTKGQRLQFYEKIGSNFREATVADVGLKYPEPLSGQDAFTIDALNGTPIGSPMMSIENELQGMLLATSPFAPGDKQRGPGHWIVPAVHIEKLLNDYRTKKPQQSPPLVQPSHD